jgi:chemotaxis signal transduction protein
MSARRACVVVRADTRLHFLPALVVARIVPVPPMGRVPGAPRELAGVAQTEGEIVPIVDLREAPSKSTGVLLVCAYMAEPIGVVVAEVIGVGHYDVDPEMPEAILVGDAQVRPLDLAKLYARLQSASFVSRVGG